MSRLAAPFLLLALAASACSFDPEVTGVWRTEDGATVSWPVLEFQGRVELVLGQYGEAVAGMLRLYEPEMEFKEIYLFPACPCLFLDQATFDNGTLVFDVIPCGAEATEWSGRFEWSEGDGGEILVGTLEPKVPAAGMEPTLQFKLRFSGGKKLIKEDELNQECPGPTL
ncbi:MAG: hypothetical protein ABIK09_15305 [Pseudomonadota bacterium]